MMKIIDPGGQDFWGVFLKEVLSLFFVRGNQI